MQTPRGYITLTTRKGARPRIACLNVGWYIRNPGFEFTSVTLLSRDLDEGNAINDTLHVTETEAEIDALIEAAQQDDSHAIIEHRMGDGTILRERVSSGLPKPSYTDLSTTPVAYSEAERSEFAHGMGHALGAFGEAR
ncbi:hypothetical protein [Gemmatimonas sp.]|uniref:hypothetical protein n=1 Tax=Gemmatimonas sp. TaxID=1962908 RepID=UPI00333F2968